MSPERFVLVDDNDSDNFFHGIALKKAGFAGEVRVFERPEEALQFLVDDQISCSTCVLLDINMPQMSGFDLARELQERLEPRSALQVFMVSSSDWEADRQRAAQLPIVDHYVCKPFTVANVQAAMTRQAELERRV